MTTLANSIRIQVGKLCLTAMLYSGSVRSLISLEVFQQMRRAGPNISLIGTDCTCVTAPGQSLEIVGQVSLAQNTRVLVVMGFPGEQNRSQPMFGADFIAKTKLVLELGSGRCYFPSAPSVYINFIKDEDHPSCSQTNSVSSSLPHVQIWQPSSG